MKAQVLHKIGAIDQRPLVEEIVPDPIPGPRDILIKIRACGVCHSNLHLIEGDFLRFGYPSKLPIIPGHEMTGVIEKVGNSVEAWQVGQRVGVSNLLKSCGRCSYCLTGCEHLCPKAVYCGDSTDGGYAEYIVAPADFVFLLPDSVGFEEGAPLFCPGVTAYRAVRRAGVEAGDRVAVIGLGGVGHMSLQFARLAGADVTVVDVSRDKLDLALKLGAINAVLPTEFGDQEKFDVVMVHAPSQKAVDQAAKAVRVGGTMLLAVNGKVDVDFSQEYTIRTSVIGSRSDVLDVLRLASKGKVKVSWTAFKLTHANETLLKLKRGEILGRAVLTP